MHQYREMRKKINSGKMSRKEDKILKNWSLIKLINGIIYITIKKYINFIWGGTTVETFEGHYCHRPKHHGPSSMYHWIIFSQRIYFDQKKDLKKQQRRLSSSIKEPSFISVSSNLPSWALQNQVKISVLNSQMLNVSWIRMSSSSRICIKLTKN